MRFLADVNIPLPLIRFLRTRGHTVIDARIKYPKSKDIELIQIARNKSLIIISKDKDFRELIKYPKYKIPMIAIRLTNQKTINIINHVENLLDNQSEDILSKSITIINEDIADSFPLKLDKP